MKQYCGHKGPWFPHPEDHLFNKYICRKCLERFEHFKNNSNYRLCENCWGIYLKDKMDIDDNAYGTFYTCKEH